MEISICITKAISFEYICTWEFLISREFCHRREDCEVESKKFGFSFSPGAVGRTLKVRCLLVFRGSRKEVKFSFCNLGFVVA